MAKIINTICFLLIIGMFTGVVVAYNKLSDKASKHHAQIKQLEEAHKKSSMSTALILNNLSMAYKYDNTTVPNYTIEDCYGKTCRLSDLLYDKKYKLVFFFSYLHCETCIANVLEKLATKKEDISIHDIVVIGEFENKRAVKAYLNNHQIALNVYFKTDGLHNEVLDEENMPFLCMMNKNLQLDHILIPIKEIPKQLDLYINCMTTRYLKNK